MRALLIESDPSAASVARAFREKGMKADCALLGEEGVCIGARGGHDIIVLDLAFPDIDGYEVLRRLRAARVGTPVIVVSGVIDVEAKIRAFRLGADDFLCKPFDREELFARIAAVIRRSERFSETIVQVGKLSFNLDGGAVAVGGELLVLKSLEQDILEVLVRRRWRTVSTRSLMDRLYSGKEEPSSRVINSYVCRLRSKLRRTSGGEEYIETVWGLGYRLRTEPVRLVRGSRR